MMRDVLPMRPLQILRREIIWYFLFNLFSGLGQFRHCASYRFIGFSDDKPVPPVNIIVPFFESLFATAIRLQFSRIDDAGHQRGETRQLFPTLAVQLFGFLADLCLTTSAFYRYGNS